MASKIKMLTEDCNFNFEEVFSEKQIYSSEINNLLKRYVKEQLRNAHEVAQRRLENNTYKGKECAQQLSSLHDELIVKYIDFLSKYLHPLNNPTEAEKISVLATGGYGRGLLAPESDIDLLFLLPYKKTAWSETAIENTLYFLWDLGLKVGQATRSISESILLAEKDQTITTSMLDARHLWGNEQLSKDFNYSYREKLEKMSSANFIQAKLDEREERQHKAGQSRYLVEPNIKNGKGGLRDLEMLSWMTNFCYNCSRPDEMFKNGILNKDESKTFLKCENFLWHVRCQLHYIAKRPEEVINFNDQREMAKRLGYEDRKGLLGVERFMRHYFLIAKEVGDLTRSICSILEEKQKKSIPVISKALAFFSEKKVESFILTAGRIDIPNKNFFKNNTEKVVDLSITPNRPDCLGVRGIARDLAAAGAGKLKSISHKNIKKDGSQNIKVSITKDKNQGCTIFASCLIKGVTNKESPKWLKEKIESLGQKPISAIVDITNYVMLDLNRPLHAYDADKIDKEIIVRDSKKGETFEALDNKEYKLDDGMCVISDKSGVLGLGGVIGGTRSGTELKTKNILLESAYFLPESVRKTSKLLNLDTDAKFRFERGIDPNSIEEGLSKAANLITEICGGKISKFDIQISKKSRIRKIKFDIPLFKKITGFKVKDKEIIRILIDLGFGISKKKQKLILVF